MRSVTSTLDSGVVRVTSSLDIMEMNRKCAQHEELSYKTFSAYMRECDYEGKEEKMEVIFGKFDRNGSGILDGEEIGGLLGVLEKVCDDDMDKDFTDNELVLEATNFADTWETLDRLKQMDKLGKAQSERMDSIDAKLGEVTSQL